jgi:N-methylhydantoinase A/oxoprolinase/acetone carboxylase beta subunit
VTDVKYGLGIDTGGTYTDAVIYDFEKKETINSSKSVTIKENLTLGINNTISQLPKELLKQVKLVSLSTTLATNACVEGKGARAVLILIGCDRDIVKKFGCKYGLPDSGKIIFLDGGHNQQGEVNAEPDWDCLRQKIDECKNNADSFAIVELWGIRNANFEKKAKQLTREWTEMPVVCGHELTTEVNSLKRAASTLLNAQLIPLINNFMNSVKTSLREMEINAPLVIVRGDGSLMSEEFAREKPVETLLSGPAASVAGGVSLSGEKDCLIVDMGGTTTDLAIVKDGMVKLAYEGVNVGDWRTGTKSILISTVGLGGDSLISFNNSNEILIGPVRVAPLSWLASRWPGVLSEMRSMHFSKKRHTRSLCEFFYLVNDITDDSYYTAEERKIVAALKNGPLSVLALAERAEASIYNMDVKRLEKLGVIMRSALTPTDIMHMSGHFRGWSIEAASIGTEIMSYQLDITVDELVSEVNTQMIKKLYFNIVKLLIENEKEHILHNGVSKQFYDMVMLGFDSGNSIKCSFSTNFALVGIGAPIHIYLPDVAKILGTRCVVSESAAVANAVGAITGNIVVEEKIIIRPIYEVFGVSRYACYSSSEKQSFEKYDDALEWSKLEVVRLAKENARTRGSGEVSIVTDICDNRATLSGIYASEEDEESNKLLIETSVTARAIGTIKWI